MRESITYEYLLDRTESNFPDCVEFLEKKKIKNVHEKIKIRCKKCGDVYDKRINDLIHGYGCRACNFTGIVTKKFRSPESFKQEVNDLTYGEYLVLGDFVDTRSKLDFFHTVCNNTFNMKVHNFITIGQRCPFCKSYAKGKLISNPVKEIIQFLEENEIEYEAEKKFSGLYSPIANTLLSFDLYLPYYDILIEYDGQQHFHPIEILGGEEWYKRCVTNDNIKNKYAIDNDITLLRIPYTKKNKIKSILSEIFCEGSTTSELFTYLSSDRAEK